MCGLSYGKMARLFRELLGLRVARSSLCRALARLARRAAPTYESLKEVLAESPVVYPDETGWRIGGRSAWLWIFTNQRQTVYHIAPGRGLAEAQEVLGADYDGVCAATISPVHWRQLLLCNLAKVWRWLVPRQRSTIPALREEPGAWSRMHK